MNRNLALASTAMLAWGLGEGLFSHFQPLYLEQLGADPLKIGALLGAVSLVAMLSYLPVGYLTDRFGQRIMLRLAFLIGTLAAVQMAASRTLTGFTLGMVFYGLSAFFNIPMSSLLTAVRGKMSIARILIMNTAFLSLGAAVGSVVGGMIGERYGLHLNFRVALPLFFVSTVLIFSIPPTPINLNKIDQSDNVIKSLWNRKFIVYSLLTFLIMFGMYLPQPFSQNFLKNERGISLETIGQLVAARNIGIVVLNLIIGQLNARVGMLISQFCMGLFAILIWLGSGFPAYLAGYLLIGSFVTARGLVIAQGRVLVNTANVSLAYSVLETTMSVVMVIGALIAGAVYAIQPEWTYAISICLIIVGILASFFSPLKHKDFAVVE